MSILLGAFLTIGGQDRSWRVALASINIFAQLFKSTNTQTSKEATVQRRVQWSERWPTRVQLKQDVETVKLSIV